MLSSTDSGGNSAANYQNNNDAYFNEKIYNGCPLFKEEVSADNPERSQKASIEETMMRVLPDLPSCLKMSSKGENLEQVTACKIQQIHMLLNRLFNE